MKSTDVDNEVWTDVITPQKGLLNVNLAELWRYRDLISMFVTRDITAAYKQTILGPLWFFIQPLFTSLTYLLIFSKVAGLSTDGIPAMLFYMSGVTMWAYFADCLNKTSNTFTANAGIFGKVYFPRLTTPVSIVISNLVKFAIQMLLLGSFICYYAVTQLGSIQLQATVFLLPFLVLLMALLGLGMGLLFSSFTTKYKDLSHLLVFAVQLMMFVTPVIYPLSSTGGKLRQALLFNPMTPVIETFRYSLFGSGSFEWQSLLYSGGVTIIILIAGILTFNQVEKSFMDTV